MTCCNEKTRSQFYNKLSDRLLRFGEETYEASGDPYIKHTHLWVFTFYREDDLCPDCQLQLGKMNGWFEKYGLFNDSTRNVKWVVEDQPDSNLIYTEMQFTKTPLHIFADSKGRIIDMVGGFPEEYWLEKYMLPVIREAT